MEHFLRNRAYFVSRKGRSGPTIPNPDGGIKVEASMCHLRGVLMTRLNRQDRAKEHFMEALALDVKCYDAFHELISGNLLGIDEGRSLLILSLVLRSRSY